VCHSKINFKIPVLGHKNIRMPQRHFSKSARFRIGGKNTGTHSLSPPETHSAFCTRNQDHGTTDLSRTNQSIKLFFGRLKTTISLREFLFCTCLPTKIGDNNTVNGVWNVRTVENRKILSECSAQSLRSSTVLLQHYYYFSEHHTNGNPMAGTILGSVRIDYLLLRTLQKHKPCEL
jgi:hypothetical protein